MTRFAILLVIMLLTVGVLACGGSSAPAVPTGPAPAATVPLSSQQQAAPAGQPPSGQDESALNLAAEVPKQLRGDEPPPPPWPTFTPGPKPESQHRLLYARSHRFYTVSAGGSDSQPLQFATKSPQLLTVSYKDSGRGWLAPNGRYLLYFAGKEGQLWQADLVTLENVLLAERMIPVGLEGSTDLVRILTEQDMAWTSKEGTRAALVGASDTVDLYIADVVTAQLTRVTQDEMREARPLWSPTDRHLAYLVIDAEVGKQTLSIFDVEAGQSAEVDLGAVRDAFGLNPADNFSFAGQLAWASDTQLIFYPATGTAGKMRGIWLYDLVSGEARPVLTDELADAAWSAEARAWVYSTPEEPGTLWLLPLDDPQPRTLVDADAYAPIWAPDGRSVLYSSGAPGAGAWDLRVVDLGGNWRTLAEGVTLIQRETSEPGPAGKRYWGPNAEVVLFTTVGRDYGRAERTEGFGGEAGPDLENWWLVPAGGGEPRQITDLQKTFYLQQPALSPDGRTWAFIGFSYTDRTQHLYTMLRDGGHPQKVDAGIRWFEWLP